MTTTTEPSAAPWFARRLADLVAIAGLLGLTVGIVLPLYQLSQPGGTVHVTIDSSVLRDASPPLTATPGGIAVSFPSEGSTDMTIRDLPGPLRFLTETPALVRGLLAIVAALLLRSILLLIAAGRPFADGVPRSITWLAIVTGGFAVLPSVAEFVAATAVLGRIGLTDGVSGLDVNGVVGDLGFVLLAALLIVIASVFRHGAALARESEGLV